jgi:hypothetical protein
VTQAILDILPGYMFDGYRVVTTGAAIPPTQHIDKKTGEVVYYLRPVFEYGQTVGMFVRHNGIVNYLQGVEPKAESSSS